MGLLILVIIIAEYIFPACLFYLVVANGDALDVLVLCKAVQTALLSVSTLLDTAEGSLGGADLSGVGTDHSDLELVGDAHDAADVLGEEVSGKTELGVVGKAEHLLLGLELEDGGQGAEGLVLGDGHLLGDTGQDGGLVEETGRVGGGAAGGDLGALGEGIGDVLLDLVDGGLVDERTLGGSLVQAAAHLEGLDLLNQLGCEGGGNALLDVESVGTAIVSIRYSQRR